MKLARATLAALLFWATAASAQSVSPGRLGVDRTQDPENVYVQDVNQDWVTIGSMTGGVFTPISGGGSFTWPGTAAVTAFGTAPANTFTVPAVNSSNFWGNSTSTVGTITTVDVGTTCNNSATPIQTLCTGTPTPGSFIDVPADTAGGIVVSAKVAGGAFSAVQFSTEVSDDDAIWYGRGLFLDSNTDPIWRNGIANATFMGTAIGGVPHYRIRATTFTVASGTPVVTIRLTQTQAAPFVYAGNLPTGADGTFSVASVSVQGNSSAATPVATNQKQINSIALGNPTAWGAAPTGQTVIGANVNCITGCSSSGNVLQATIFPAGGNSGTAATTQQIVGVAGQNIYLINYSWQGQSSVAGTFRIIGGTSPNCTGAVTNLSPLYDMTSSPAGAPGSIGPVAATGAGAAMCVVTTGSNNITWNIGATQQ